MSLGAPELVRLSALLDQALDMGPDALQAWLASLEGDDALLSPTLRTLLARRAEAETGDLLVRGPSFTAPQAEAPTYEFSSGELVGAYRLEREIGRGGMGEVWLAAREDGQLKRRVALKLPVLSTRRSVLTQRFARERDILAPLAHPNIARLYDAGVSPAGQPYLALEYVDGQPITAYCEARALDVRDRAQLLQQVLQAVQYAHASLVIHRDLKPSNVLVTRDGHAMLLDFGIAKMLQDDHPQAAETELTQLGGRAMTLEYAAPEQISGAPISIATDVWALGVLLYELVAKRRPFTGDTRGGVEQAILSEEPVPPCSGMGSGTLRRGLRADLDTIVLKALKKAPAERYATVNALAEDIDRWLRGDPVLAQADSSWYRTRKFCLKHKGAVATAVAVTAVVIAAGGVSVWQALIAKEQTRVAQSEARTAAAVQSFLEGVFRANSGDQADPLKGRQRTAKDLLDEGAKRIDKALEDAPQAKLHVLKTLADMYEDMEQLDDAANLHGRRAALAERIEGPESSARLHALSDQANLLTSAERLPEAKKVLDRAAQVQSHGHHDSDALIAFDLAEGWYGYKTDAGKGLQANGLALELLRKRPPSARLVYALNQRGTLLNALNRPREAVPLFRESASLATQQTSLSTSTVSGTLRDLAVSLEGLGEKTEAEQAYRAAIGAAKRYHGATSGNYVVAEVMLSQFLSNSNRLRESTASASRALDVLRTWPDSPERRALILNTAAIAAGDYIELGLLPQAMTLLDEGASAFAAQPGNPQFMALLSVRRAAVFTEWGRDEEAMRELDQTEALIKVEKNASRTLLYREAAARITLAARQHRPQDAQAALIRWQGRTGRSLPPKTDDLVALMLTCRVRAAQGDLATARELCEAALTLSSNPARRGDPILSEGRIGWLLGSILLRNDATAAVPVLRRAVERLEATLDPDRSPAVAGARIALAQALLAVGDRDGAGEALAGALAIAARHPELSPYYLEPLRRVNLALRTRGALVRVGVQEPAGQ